MNKRTFKICMTGISAALAFGLSYFKIPIGVSFGGFGGSIDLVMIPIIVAGYYLGTGYGLCAGFIVGTVKYFLAGGFAITWESMLLDYTIAYAAVGLSGLVSRFKNRLWLGALIGSLARFLVHFLSGITIYAEYAGPIFGVDNPNIFIYSVLYNGSYMLPNTIIAVAVCALALLYIPFGKFLKSSEKK